MATREGCGLAFACIVLLASLSGCAAPRERSTPSDPYSLVSVPSLGDAQSALGAMAPSVRLLAWREMLQDQVVVLERALRAANETPIVPASAEPTQDPVALPSRWRAATESCRARLAASSSGSLGFDWSPSTSADCLANGIFLTRFSQALPVERYQAFVDEIAPTAQLRVAAALAEVNHTRSTCPSCDPLFLGLAQELAATTLARPFDLTKSMNPVTGAADAAHLLAQLAAIDDLLRAAANAPRGGALPAPREPISIPQEHLVAVAFPPKTWGQLREDPSQTISTCRSFGWVECDQLLEIRARAYAAGVAGAVPPRDLTSTELDATIAVFAAQGRSSFEQDVAILEAQKALRMHASDEARVLFLYGILAGIRA